VLLPALADVDQLADALGKQLADIDARRAQAVLDRVSAKARLVTAPHTWATGPVPDVVVAVVLDAAMRAYTNPQGYTQQTVADVSVSIGARSASATYFTAEEKADLRSAAGLSGLTSVALASPYPPVPRAVDDLEWLVE
jgi:hypothetical protein